MSIICQGPQDEELGGPSGPYGTQGAPHWLAPEYVMGHTGGKKHKPGDVYSWGCVVLEVSSLWFLLPSLYIYIPELRIRFLLRSRLSLNLPTVM